jgi:hypothetical protein
LPGWTERLKVTQKKQTKKKRSGKNSGGTGISSAAPIVGAVFGLLVKVLFSNALALIGAALIFSTAEIYGIQ